MTSTDIEQAVAEELARIAPDVALAEIDRSADIREEFDIDSMDFLRLLTALGQRFGLEMPEADYSEMESFDALVRYLARRASSKTA